MILKQLFGAVPVALLVRQQRGKGRTDHQRDGGPWLRGRQVGREEPDKGHKLVAIAGRCALVPDDPAAPKYTEDCIGKYEYLPDRSWKGSGNCTQTFKGGDKIYDSWEEGWHLKEYSYKFTGGAGKFQGASGGGTYTSETLTTPCLLANTRAR